MSGEGDDSMDISDNNDNDEGIYPAKGGATPWGATPGGPTPGGDVDEESEDYEEDELDANRNNVDLCILCDVTDSMNAWIKAVKRGIRGIVNELKSTFGIGTLRLAFIGYRDYDDNDNNEGEKRIEQLKFTTNITKFEQFVKKCKPVGGGDAAEDVLGGIQAALNLNWKAPIRVVYHICDAPAHGTVYHDLFEHIKAHIDDKKKKMNVISFLDGLSDESSDEDEDKDDEVIGMKGDNDEEQDLEQEEQILRDEFDLWPNKHPKDPKHEDLFLDMKKKQIQFFMGTQTQFTDKMVRVFQKCCKEIEYTHFSTMDLANVMQFLPTLIEAVSDAIRVKFIKPDQRPEINLNLDELKKKKVNFQVHCGIDFGTAGSGFAYALAGRNEVFTDQNWNDSGKHVDVKTKTNILLDTKGNCIAFGDDATDKYVRTDNKDLFFERFKMALYEKHIIEDDEKKLEDDNKDNDKEDNYRIDIRENLEAANGETLPSRKVLEEAIRFMKDHAMKNLRAKVNKNLKVDEVQWILTVPAIWSDAAKSVMQTAAINAGMINPDIDGQLLIAYEPDCASLSIQHEINEKLRLQHENQLKIKRQKLEAAKNSVDGKDNEDDLEEEPFTDFFEKGDKILLCDLGGGTADIACHQVDDEGRIRQIAAPSGGAWGSTYVDENFLAVLRQIFGEEWMTEFQKKYPAKYIEILGNFREAKKNYKNTESKKVKKKAYDTTFHNVKVPFMFQDFMSEKAEEKAELEEEEDGVVVGDEEEDDDSDALEKMIQNFKILGKKGLIQLEGEYLEISYTLWNHLFDQVVDKIINHVKKLLDSQEMEGCKYLCLAGGFSQSKHLQTKIFKAFGTKSEYEVMIFTPRRPILSVVDGAARMGLRPDFISARTIAKTYGIAIQKDLEEFKRIYPNANTLIPKNKIGRRNIYADKDNKQMLSKQVINDVFLPFVRKNNLIKNSDKPVIYWIEPADVKSDTIKIRLYDSLEIDPMFVDNRRKNTEIEITLSSKFKERNQPIPLIFIFNDTTIRLFIETIDDDGQTQTEEVSVNFDAK